MGITLEEVEHVARLARLELDQAELFEFQGELNALLGHFEDLNRINVDGIEPLPHAVILRHVLAEDVARFGLSREQAMRNAPISKGGLFVVPTIIED